MSPSDNLPWYGMELRAEIAIKTPAAAAWAVVGERFGQIAEWAAPITASSVDGELAIGATRTCHVTGFGPVKAGVVKERLLAFDRQAMFLEYESTAGLPTFVDSAVNRWSVHPSSDAGCVVRSHAILHLKRPMRLLAPFVARKLQGEAARVLDELRHQVEYGRPHPRKDTLT